MTISRPTMLRPVKGDIRIKLPYQEGTRKLLNQLPTRTVTWSAEKQEWSVHRRHLKALVDLLLTAWPEILVLIDVVSTQRCDTRCKEATGAECVCSCGYVNHADGGMIEGWILVGETTLIKQDIRRFSYSVDRAKVPKRVR